MHRILSILVAIGSLVAGFHFLIADDDAPTRRVLRAFTVDGPRCLICNDAAAISATYVHDFDRRTPQGKFAVDHALCLRHAGADYVYFTWPNVDKYLFAVAAILFHVAAVVAGIAGVWLAFAGDNAGASLLPPALFGFGYLATHAMTIFA